MENTFFRYKSIIGDGLRARSPAGQGSEAVIGCEIPQTDDRPRPTSVVSHRPVRILSIGIVRASYDSCNNALVRRGDVTVWLSSEAIAAWTPRRSGRRGVQRRYSDLAIETALTLRLLYHLPLRQAEGFLHALFGMMRLDLSAPDYTTLSRRSQHLTRRLRLVPPGESLHLVLDSTGLSIVGEGEWAAAKHGGRGRRGWRKLHLGVDRSGVIRVHTLTEATGEDATTALDLLNAVDGPLVRITADASSGAPDIVRRVDRDTARWPATSPVRGGGMRRSPADSTNRSLAAFGKLQHILLNSFIVSNTPSHVMKLQWAVDKADMVARHILFQDEDKDTYLESLLSTALSAEQAV